MTHDNWIKLTPVEQKIKVAKLCGTMPPSVACYGMDSIPKYPTDLNACHEMEKRLDRNQRVTYASLLTRQFLDEHYLNVMPDDLDFYVCFPALHATAAQRCEAFVLTMEPE
jgi:hypothetical protein